MTQKTAQAKCHPDSVRPPLSGWSSGALWPVRQLQKLKVQRTNRDSVLLRWALDEWLFLPGAGLFAWPWLRYAGCWARSGQSGHWRELNRRQSSYFLLRLSATRVCFQWKSRSCLLSSAQGYRADVEGQTAAELERPSGRCGMRGSGYVSSLLCPRGA